MYGEEPKCHFCGDTEKPHMLSNCRPDLVKHEPGPDCTWSYDDQRNFNCYAYQDPVTRQWDTEHKHFYPDTNMTGEP